MSLHLRCHLLHTALHLHLNQMFFEIIIYDCIMRNSTAWLTSQRNIEIMPRHIHTQQASKPSKAHYTINNQTTNNILSDALFLSKENSHNSMIVYFEYNGEAYGLRRQTYVCAAYRMSGVYLTYRMHLGRIRGNNKNNILIIIRRGGRHQLMMHHWSS